MSATQAQYTAAANAIMAILQADINADVPSWEQGFIPADLASQLAGPLAKASVDAALSVTPPPSVTPSS